MINIIDGNICAPQGFLAGSIHSGIRKNPEKADLAIIYSTQPAEAAGVFTVNQIKAAPVLLTQKHISEGILQAIIVNSGNANACTGELGKMHAAQMTQTVAKELKIKNEHIAVASTGVIGVNLPIQNIVAHIPQISKQLSSDGTSAASAIMTTDTFPKAIAVEVDLGGKKVKIGGIAKGSGMIHPNMATMLAFITTDINISQECLHHALKLANQASFNMITVDGESSTNDMTLILANGLAQNPRILSINDPDWHIFYDALLLVCTFLAKEIARDGEGATKLVEVQVHEAASIDEARLAARSICRSPLVKTAIFGEDANWGRIASALGACGVLINPDRLNISLDQLILFKDGSPFSFDETKASELLAQKNVVIKVNLGVGNTQATAWGCDLTYDYIKINASYRS